MEDPIGSVRKVGRNTRRQRLADRASQHDRDIGNGQRPDRNGRILRLEPAKEPVGRHRHGRDPENDKGQRERDAPDAPHAHECNESEHDRKAKRVDEDREKLGQEERHDHIVPTIEPVLSSGTRRRAPVCSESMKI